MNNQDNKGDVYMYFLVHVYHIQYYSQANYVMITPLLRYKDAA